MVDHVFDVEQEKMQNIYDRSHCLPTEVQTPPPDRRIKRITSIITKINTINESPSTAVGSILLSQRLLSVLMFPSCS